MAKGIPSKMGQRRSKGARTEPRELAPALHKAVVLIVGDGRRIVLSMHTTIGEASVHLEHLSDAIDAAKGLPVLGVAAVARVDRPYKVGESWNPETEL